MLKNKEIVLLCSECNNPLEIERHDILGWHIKPCEKCLENQREEILDALGEEECYEFCDTCSICDDCEYHPDNKESKDDEKRIQVGK